MERRVAGKRGRKKEKERQKGGEEVKDGDQGRDEYYLMDEWGNK